MTIKEVRNIIFCRDGNKCCRCNSTEMLCLDHLLPKPLFQIHKVNNLMTLCLRCNFKKGAHPLTEEEFYKREEYIIKANTIFNDAQINEMNKVLHEYFMYGKGKPQKKKGYKPRQISLRHYEEYCQKTST